MVDLHRAGGVAGEREGVGRGEQVYGVSMSVRDLVGIDGDLVEGVEDRGDLEPAPLTEMLPDPLRGDRV